jgi:hypothetical protein
MRCTLSKWGGLVAILAASSAASAATTWVSEIEPTFGYAYSYPAGTFAPIANDDKPHFRYFASSASDAEFLVGAWQNSKQQTPEAFKRWLIENLGGYDELTYRPRGRSWFVMSGYRGDSIYYEKVMFSCRAVLVNVFAISYPADQRQFYDQVVERMEDSFRPGRNCPE